MRVRASRWFAATLAVVAVGTAPRAWSEDALLAVLDPSGTVRVRRGDKVLATFELNAHGPGWSHAPQTDGKATVTDLPGKAGKRVAGLLPVPKTDGGAIQYTQTLATLPRGFRMEYELSMDKTMKINGLQFSVTIPVDGYAGRDVLVAPATGEARLVGLPKEQPAAGRFQLWAGQGARVDIAKDTPDAIAIELRAATDVAVQDLRQWEQPVFEIRFPAFSEDAGRELAKGLRFHFDLVVTTAAPLRMVAAGTAAP